MKLKEERKKADRWFQGMAELGRSYLYVHVLLYFIIKQGTQCCTRKRLGSQCCHVIIDRFEKQRLPYYM